MVETIFEPLLTSPLLALFVLAGIGLLLGNVHVGGISLGSSGVVFAALIAGHFGATVPSEAGQIGLALFVYCVGIGAGGRFFSALKREGSQLARLALVVTGSAAITTWALAKVFALDFSLAVGIFAGALTSTPALAAAIEGTHDLGASVVIGYGVAYPFGVIGVVLFVQLLPRLLRLDLDEGHDDEPGELQVIRQLVEVTNPNLFGRAVSDEVIETLGACHISRVWRDGRMEPVRYEDIFEEGQLVLLVGEQRAVKLGISVLGRPSTRKILLDADEERQSFVVTSRSVTGRTFEDVSPLKNHGVVITRVSRMELIFAPDGSTRFEPHDVLTVVGPKENLAAFGSFVGHRPQASSETSLVSLAIGVAIGIIVGKMTIPLPGETEFSLGMAGGPLLVALLLGHIGRVGRIVGHIPRPTRMLLQEMGLVFFLADAGVKGGSAIVDAVATQGFKIFVIGAVITIIPMIVGYIVARRFFGMSLGQSLGGICGGMTSTPALGAIISKTARQVPIVSYATVYPIAVILMALLAKVLLHAIH